MQPALLADLPLATRALDCPAIAHGVTVCGSPGTLPIAIRFEGVVQTPVRLESDSGGKPASGPGARYAGAAARPAAARSAAALSVRSHVKSWSSRPKWP